MPQLLIIEDKESLRSELAEVFMMEGYDVIEAEDGLQGIELARTQLPDLIVCDIMLPHLDGFEVLQKIQEDSTTTSIPLVFVSARAEKATIEKGIALGAKAYITKPFSLADLLNAITTNLPH